MDPSQQNKDFCGSLWYDREWGLHWNPAFPLEKYSYTRGKDDADGLKNCA